jgi:hypothetical protein
VSSHGSHGSHGSHNAHDHGDHHQHHHGKGHDAHHAEGSAMAHAVTQQHHHQQQQKPAPHLTVHTQASKQFRSTFTAQELFDAIFDVRKVSVMRGLMEGIDTSVTHTTILRALMEEVTALKASGEMSQESFYIPIKNCFKVLGDLHDLRLNRSQILFIISWAECFDKDGVEVDVVKFAEHAAGIISKITAKEMMETRADVVNKGSFDEKKILNGMRENELEMHLAYALASLNAEDHVITSDQLKDVLKEIPRLNLSERDCSALVIPFDPEHLKGPLNWKEHLHAIVSMIITHCRERIIHRRLSLHVTSSVSDFNAAAHRGMTSAARALHDEARNQLKQLADKLLNFVKIQMVGDNRLVIHLPIDNEKRRTAQLTGFDEHNHHQQQPSVMYQGVRYINWNVLQTVFVQQTMVPPSPMVRQSSRSMLRNSISIVRASTQAAAAATGGAGGALGEHRLSSAGLPGTTSAAAAATAAAMGSSGGSAAAAGVETKYEKKSSRKMPFFVSIVAAENASVHPITTLYCKLINATGSCRLQSVLPLKMPSIGLVDREAAHEFACNVVDKMYVDQIIGGATELKMKES